MAQPAHAATYSARGFLKVLAFCAALISGGGWIGYLSARESYDCRRAEGGRVDCTIARSLAGGIPIGSTVLADVAEPTLESRPAARFSALTRSHRSGDGFAHRLRFVYQGAQVHRGVQADHSDLEAARRGLAALFAADPGRPATHREVVVGNPGALRVATTVAGVGVAILLLWTAGYFVPALRPKPRRGA